MGVDASPGSENIVDARPRAIAQHDVGPIAYGCWRLATADPGEAQMLIETAHRYSIVEASLGQTLP